MVDSKIPFQKLKNPHRGHEVGEWETDADFNYPLAIILALSRHYVLLIPDHWTSQLDMRAVVVQSMNELEVIQLDSCQLNSLQLLWISVLSSYMASGKGSG